MDFLFRVLRRFLQICLFVLACLCLENCSKYKYVPKGKYLLTKNRFRVDIDKKKNKNLIQDLEDLVEQTPNQTLFYFPLKLHIYNLSNKERLQLNRKKNQLKAQLKNKKRALKNKKKVLPRLCFDEKLQKLGEAPVLIDSISQDNTIKKMERLLFNRGYFDNEIEYSIVPHPRKRKATIQYNAKFGKRYLIKTITHHIYDSTLSKYLSTIEGQSIILPNTYFDVNTIKKQREKIERFFRNKGFFTFKKKYVQFEIDTSENNIDLHLYIDTPKASRHKKKMTFFRQIIKDVQIKTDVKNTGNSAKKTRQYEGFSITSPYKMFNKTLFDRVVFLKKGQVFNEDNLLKTYAYIQNLDYFSSTKIRFKTIDDTSLIATIDLSNPLPQVYSISSEGTHRNGMLGVNGKLTYEHRNIFRNCEKFGIELNASAEIQPLLSQQSKNNSNLSNTFNTFEIAPKLFLNFPHFLFFEKWGKNKKESSTQISGIYQVRFNPDFQQQKQAFSIGYIWKTKSNNTIQVMPFEISFVKIDKTKNFADRLEKINDILLLSSYRDYMFWSGGFSFFKEQNIRRNRYNLYFDFETSGNLLNAIYQMTSQPKNKSDKYEFSGIQFAHFVKFYFDGRYYAKTSKHGEMAFRLSSGVGVPLSNSNDIMPFEKSFFSGGANRIRAWKPRTLGPGGHYDPQQYYNKIGDVFLEGNIEYRFNIFGNLNGAFFSDFGNIWLMNPDPIRTKGQFKWDKFLDEIAVGFGFGLRLDSKIFIIRTDFALPIKNPALPENERWLFDRSLNAKTFIDNKTERKTFFPVIFNIGIGYPF